MSLKVILLQNFNQKLNKKLISILSDPRVENYPLLDSPLSIIAIISAYVYFVTSWGPSLMKNRKPFELKWILIIFNAFQILLNLFIGTIGFYYYFMQNNFSFSCQLINHEDNEGSRRLVFVTYLYFSMKLIDLLDTVFYVMRKKNNQITFLHVYHHAGIVVGAYIFTKFLAGKCNFVILILVVDCFRGAHVQKVRFSKAAPSILIGCTISSKNSSFDDLNSKPNT